MIPLFDMMMQAQNGQSMDVMARQFGLAQEQMSKAAAALMPAFSAGLKRKSTNPYDFSALLTTMSTGTYAQYFEDVGKAFTPQGLADGNGILGQIFGSKDMSRAIAAQAEQVTGIGQEIYKQMLPAMASAIMGGLFKQTTGQLGTFPMLDAGPSMTAMMQQWMEATGMAKKPNPAANPFDNPFTQAMTAFFATGKMQGRADPAPDATDLFAANPFMKAFQDMLKPAAEPAPAPEPTPAAAYAQMFNTMFDSGLTAQREYQKSIDALFNR